MIERFETGKYYVYDGPPLMSPVFSFVLDNQPHKCVGAFRTVCMFEENISNTYDWVGLMGYWKEVDAEGENEELASRILPKKLKRKTSSSKGGW